MPSPWLAETADAPAGAPRPSPFPSKGVPWWTRAFERAYLAVYGHRDEEEARRFAPHVARLLSLRHSSRILDLACGEGRYSRVLASRGFRMTGVDLSATLLDEAMRASPLLPGAPTYLRCDMRDLPFEAQFEGVVSIFTSFGYFDDPADDLRVLRGVHRALVPGGRFLLDFLNEPQVRASLVPESEERRPPWTIRSRRAIDEVTAGGPYVHKEIRVTDERTGHVDADVEERVRLYAPDALDALLDRAGFALVGSRYGDLDGSPWSPASPRCVRVARTPSKGRPAFVLASGNGAA